MFWLIPNNIPRRVSINKILLMCLCIVTLLLQVCHDAAFAEDNGKYHRVLKMYNDYKNDFPDVADISANAALLLLNEPNTLFVDVRKEKEREVSTIPGAITKKQFLKEIERYRNMNIIAYCTISYRSGKFAEKMAKKGVAITNLQAGLLGWVHAGGPLVAGGRQVKKLHVYGKKWDLAPADIQTVY